MTNDVDLMIAETLLLGASNAFRDIAQQLFDLRVGWVAHGASCSAVDWLDDLIAEAEWWRGRIEAAADSY